MANVTFTKKSDTCYETFLTVTADFNIHIEPSVNSGTMYVMKKTAGSNFEYADFVNFANRYASRDRDYHFSVYPKTIKLVCSVPITSCVLTESIVASGATAEELAEIREELARQAAINDAQQEQIDNNTSVNNTQQEQIDANTELNEQQEQSIQDNTALADEESVNNLFNS